jgi:hypothetical protein
MACYLTRACSRQDGLARNTARAAPPSSALWSIGWCGRRLEGPQLMRISLDRSKETFDSPRDVELLPRCVRS